MIKKELFELGQVVCTSRIANDLGQFVAATYIGRHVTGDFGNMCEEDIETNNDAIKNNNGNIVSSYMHDGKKVFVITEHDRSSTTVLYADEY